VGPQVGGGGQKGEKVSEGVVWSKTTRDSKQVWISVNYGKRTIKSESSEKGDGSLGNRGGGEGSDGVELTVNR